MIKAMTWNWQGKDDDRDDDDDDDDDDDAKPYQVVWYHPLLLSLLLSLPIRTRYQMTFFVPCVCLPTHTPARPSFVVSVTVDTPTVRRYVLEWSEILTYLSSPVMDLLCRISIVLPVLPATNTTRQRFPLPHGVAR